MINKKKWNIYIETYPISFKKITLLFLNFKNYEFIVKIPLWFSKFFNFIKFLK